VADLVPAEPFAGYRRIVPVLVAAAVVGAVLGDRGTALQCLLAVLAGLAVVARSWRPWIPVPLVAVVVAALLVPATRTGKLEASLFVLCIVATIAGMFEPSTRWFVATTALLLVVPGLDRLVLRPEINVGAWTGGIALSALLGRTSRRQAVLSLELAEARAEIADRQVAEERRRIARDVHDSVGHGLAAMLLHITAARHVLRRDVDAADDSLAEAEAAGRVGLSELRQTLGVLRSDAGTPLAPVPGTRQLAELAEHGELQVVGDLGRLDASVSLSLHRVVQEALDNAHRHAPLATTTALLEVDDHAAVLTVASLGVVGAPVASGRAHYGIVGMTERVRAVGGAIEVGPTADGWLVRAEVPVT
jgi:signal transduction histidine kinase